MEEDGLQTFRALPVFRSDLEDDVVLIQLRIDQRDFGLTEGGVQRSIEGLSRLTLTLPQSRDRSAAPLIESAVLLVGTYVLKAWKMHHLRKQLRSPCRKVGKIIGLDGVLIKCIAATSADAKVLRRLEKSRGSGQLVQAGDGDD